MPCPGMLQPCGWQTCCTQAGLLPSWASNWASYRQLMTVQQQLAQDGEQQRPSPPRGPSVHEGGQPQTKILPR